MPPTLIRPRYKVSPPWHLSLRLGFQLPQHILEQQAWLQISLSGFSIPAESSHWTPSLLCHAELATMVGDKNRHTGRQVSQALSQLQACCDRGVCPSPHAIPLRDIEMAGEQKPSHCSLPSKCKELPRGTRAGKPLSLSSPAGSPTDMKSRQPSRPCPQTTGLRGPSNAQQPQC